MAESSQDQDMEGLVFFVLSYFFSFINVIDP